MLRDFTERLRRLANTPLLLVACDFDGTLADLVDDPKDSTPHPESVAAIEALASTPWTMVAIISGRSLADLRNRVPGIAGALMIGSHGAEWKTPGVVLAPAQQQRLAEVSSGLALIASKHRGVRWEPKPAGVVLHTRGADPQEARRAGEAAMARFGHESSIRVQHGIDVIEFTVTTADKGAALRRARHDTGATGVCFLGDDLTDEHAFESLHPSDMGVKVGGGETSALHRVGGVAEVAQVLASLAKLRREWAETRRLTQLERCAILADRRTIAVVTPGARIEWLCLPELDSAAVFAGILGGEAAGVFSIAPDGEHDAPEIEYDSTTFTLVTKWPGLQVVDYLDCSGGRTTQRPGRSDLVRVIEGNRPARLVFAPRLDYGHVPTRLTIHDQGLEVEGSNDPVVLFSPGVQWEVRDDGAHQVAEATVDPTRGAVLLELRYGTESLKHATTPEPERRRVTNEYWSEWAQGLRPPTVARDAVLRSALVLRALSFGPTGAIAAAATTSLPEQLGGVRNWDYRYCWPRDAAKAAAALVRLGDTTHALHFLDWMLGVVDRSGFSHRISPIYTLAGGALPTEGELADVPGYGGSRPVRLSNAAAHQVQLDVFGPIVNLIALLAEREAPVTPEHWRLIEAMIHAVEARWREPDHGIWEMRQDRRHHVHTKAMCWSAVDNALAVEEAIHGHRNPKWEILKATIRDDVLERGWSERLGVFPGEYGGSYLDAACLKVGLVGMLAHDDPRWISTVNAIAAGLRDGATVRRYRVDDGLPGDEGGMHICTGWLVEALLTLGRRDEARRLFDGMVALVEAPGVMTEQYDWPQRRALGNIAQAYSHLAVINAAIALDATRE